MYPTGCKAGIGRCLVSREDAQGWNLCYAKSSVIHDDCKRVQVPPSRIRHPEIGGAEHDLL